MLKIQNYIAYCACFLLCFCSKISKQSDTPSQVVKEYKVGKENVAKLIEITGKVSASKISLIHSPTGGRIDKLFIEEGQKVKKNEVVALMSSSSRVKLLEMSHGLSSKEKRYWQSQVLQAKIFAPASGIVTKIKLHENDKISSSVASIMDKYIVKANVDEIDISKIKNKQECIITVEALNDKTKRFAGYIEYISMSSKSINNVNVYDIKASFKEDLSDKLRLGMSASIEIPYETVNSALVLSSKAVNNKFNTEVNLNVKGAEQEMLKVKLGDLYDDKVHIISGLKEHDRVLTIEKPMNFNQNKKKSMFDFFK